MLQVGAEARGVLTRGARKIRSTLRGWRVRQRSAPFLLQPMLKFQLRVQRLLEPLDPWLQQAQLISRRLVSRLQVPLVRKLLRGTRNSRLRVQLALVRWARSTYRALRSPVLVVRRQLRHKVMRQSLVTRMFIRRQLLELEPWAPFLLLLKTLYQSLVSPRAVPWVLLRQQLRRQLYLRGLVRQERLPNYYFGAK